MKVALVHDYLNQFGGGERVLLSLMKLFPEAPVYTLMYDKKKTHGLFEGPAGGEARRVRKTSFLDFPLARRHHRWFIPLMPLAIQSMNLGGEYDLIISDSHGFSKGIRYDRTKTKHISYIHTPLRYVWETATYFSSEGGSASGGGLASWLVRFFGWPAFAYLRHFDYHAAQKPDILLANSKYIAGKIKKYYHRSAAVVYPPITFSAGGHSKESKTNYYLAVGRFLEYKRFDLIIKAFNRTHHKLKIVGAGRLEKQLKKLAHGSARIEFLPFQSDERLISLYSHAKAFIMANEEDFGMVMAEAQSCGTPVIAYVKGGALEIVEGGKTGVLFSEQTPESLVSAIQRFETLKFDRDAIHQSADRFSEANFIAGLQKSINLLK